MGFLDSIMGEDKDTEMQPKDKNQNPLEITLSFTPLRLSANRVNSVDLIVRIKNRSDSPHLISLDAFLPKNSCLGFDNACINKSIEKKAGELKPGQATELSVRIWSNNQTKAGSYPVGVDTYSHYLNYDKVLSTIKKSTSLRVA